MKIRRSLLALVLCAFSWNGRASAADPLEVPMKYRTVVESSRDFSPRGSVSPDFTNQPPEGQWTLPEWKSRHPLFALVKLGDQERLMVLDVAGPASRMFDRVFFDANGNRDLSDDPVITGKARRNVGSYINVEFPAIEATIEHEGRAHPYRFEPSIYAYARDSDETSKAFPGYSVRFSMEIQCYYEGALEIGGKKYSLLLADSNGNGIFGDALTRCSNCWARGRVHLMGDTVYLSAGGKPGYHDGNSFGDQWHIGGQLFTAALDPAREKLTLIPADGPLYPVTLGAEAERVLLFDDKDTKSIMCFRPGREIQLPAGTYRFVDYRLLRKETNGALWHLKASTSTGAVPVKVGADQKPEIVFGEPFRPVVEVPDWARASRSGRPVRLNFEVYGVGNETVSEVSLLSGTSSIPLGKRGSRPKEPSYTISTPDGELVQRGTFEYG